MTDRELLEMAAKAAGLQIHARNQAERDAMGFGHVGFWLTNGSTCWNPLTDDGDALRLAVKLGITVTPNYHAEQQGLGVIVFTELEDSADFCSATRRAIVRAAAEMGKQMA